MTGDALVAHCVKFCRTLRARGVPVTPAETLLASRTLGCIDIGDREDVRLGLRTALVLRQDEYAVFEEVFDEMWGAGALFQDGLPGEPAANRVPLPPPQNPGSRITQATWMRGDQGTRAEHVPVPEASDLEAPGRRDFSRFDNQQSAAFERAARRIARRLAMRRSRRWEVAKHGTRLDLRRIIRSSVRAGGEVAVLEWRRRKIRRTRLVAICDVSGSMEPYSRFLLQFLHALQNSFARIDTFVFSTRLTRTSGLLKNARWEHALAGVSREVTDWSGGTRIGASLATFADDWITIVDRRTVVIILSDGWDTGEPEVLGRAMKRLHDRAGRIIWLNPLMASVDYEPATRGMKAALPHIDLFAPVHNLESLEKLTRHLSV